MTCTHHLYDATGLACTRTDDHDPAAAGGHVYAGSYAADGHTDSEDAAEASRG